jgi:prepilin-type N-terminal cleavage/methylation domain-containing protein
MPPCPRVGFTLVELSIVLVIIGLVVGGVMVGKDLIEAAAIRAQVSEIEKYNIAVHTFRTKYGSLPGDILSTKASSFGMFSSSLGNSAGYGDDNGSITSFHAQRIPYFIGEPVIFWRHLSDAQLIDGSYSQTGAAAGNITVTGSVAVNPTTAEMMNAHVPKAKIGAGASIVVGSYPGTNYYAISGINSFDKATLYFSGSTNPLTANEAYSIDKKIDDGFPAKGSVLATDSTIVVGGFYQPLPGWMPLNTINTCVASGVYATTPGRAQSCSLQFQFH